MTSIVCLRVCRSYDMLVLWDTLSDRWMSRVRLNGDGDCTTNMSN